MDKSLLIKSVLWDYDIAPEEIERLIKGEVNQVYHYTLESFVHKMIENLPWYSIISIIPPAKMVDLLTESFVDSIRQPSLRKQYKYVRSKLYGVVFPSNESITVI